MRKYGKSVVAVLVTVAVALQSALSGGGVDSTEWVQVVLAGVGGFAVFVLPNLPTGVAHYTKGAVAVATAVLTTLGTAVLGGLDQSELINLFIVAAGAVGIYAAPSQSDVPQVVNHR